MWSPFAARPAPIPPSTGSDISFKKPGVSHTQVQGSPSDTPILA